MNEPKLRFKADDGSQFPDWEEKKFYEVIKLYRGSSPRPIVEYIVDDNQGLNWIKISDVPQNGNVIVTVKEHISKEGAKKSRAVYKGEIILSNSMSFGKPCILGIDGFIHDGWFVVREYEKYLNKWYLCQLLDSDIMYKQYRRLAAGGVVLNISSEIVNSTKIPVPSLPEQQKIAEFLSTIDTVIEKQKETVSVWEERKKGVMQKLFSQEVRFKADDKSDFPDWEMKPFGNVISEFKIKTKVENEDTLLSCAINGVFLNSELFGHQRGKSNIGYLKIKKGTLILSAQNLHLGNANVNMRFEHGIISPAYKTYDIIGCSVEYMNQWVKWDMTKQFFYNATTVGASGCRRNVEWDSLYSQLISIPCLEEQQKIAACLSSLDEVIEKQKATLAAWEELKKGLLQQMFV